MIVDPIMAFLGEKKQTNSDPSVRRALSPFKTLAEETGAVVIMVRHLNKQVDLRAEYRGGGSHGGFIGLSRFAFIVGNDPDDEGRFSFVHSKSNLGPKGPAISYQISPFGEVDDADGQPIETAGVVWGAISTMDADTLLRAPDSRKTAPAREACWRDMKALLDEADPRPADEAEKLLKKAGHTADTIQRTKQHHNVYSRQRRENHKIVGWDWSLSAG